MSGSQLATRPVGAAGALMPGPRHARERPSPGRAWRRLGLLAASVAAAVVVYVLQPGAVTDDTYAFLDWGRDLRHGFLPLLEHRTFQPLPILAGSMLSLFGSAAPTLTVLGCLVALFLTAAAAWRAAELLGAPQPGPVLAAALALGTPLLPVLALSGYNNLPFATLVLWALVFELEERRTAAWVMLVLAGLTRPEAWLFLIAYGLLEWWRDGHPLAPRRWLGTAALALGPLVVWALLEWALFGDPLYSLRNTTTPVVASTHTSSPRALWFNLRAYFPPAALVASGVGAVALAALARRDRRAATALAATILAALSIVILAASSFNVPGRDFSALIAVLCVLAAVGATLPARLLRSGEMPAWAGAAAAFVGVALVVGLAFQRSHEALKSNLREITVSHETGRTLSEDVTRTLPLIDVRSAGRHSVAMVGAVANSELAWLLGVPYNVVVDHQEPPTRLIVQPSAHTWVYLAHHDLTNRERRPLPRGWHVVSTGAWEIYGAGHATPVALR